MRRFAAEGLFGHVNRYHNGDKAPYREGAMDHIAQLRVAFTSNLEKLAAHAKRDPLLRFTALSRFSLGVARLANSWDGLMPGGKASKPNIGPNQRPVP